MTVDLAGKVFIVTSSASGMGHATARTPAQRGVRLALCDINGPALEKVAKELNHKENEEGEPYPREWPAQKCKRCMQNDFPCSANETADGRERRTRRAECLLGM